MTLNNKARLSGDTAIVTGSTSGLGKVVAEMFGAEGAQVVVTGRNEAKGAEMQSLLESQGADALFVKADLTQEKDIQNLLTKTEEAFGQLTVLVNNAVLVKGDNKLTEVSSQTFQEILDTNLLGPVNLMKQAIPYFEKAGRGSIVNISSRTAERASPNLAAYTASKGALTALTRSIALDYSRQNIRVNTIQPGYILHEVRDKDISKKRQKEIEAMCLTRPATAQDVAYGCVYLASREAETITGITLNIDSGSTAARAATFDV